jgi:hypothetical protein
MIQQHNGAMPLSCRPRVRLAAWFGLCVLLALDAAWVLLDVGNHVGFGHGLILDALATVFVLIVLAFVGSRPAMQGLAAPQYALLIGLLAGAAFYFRVWGTALLDPAHVGWLMQGDWAQHYTGWELFRQGPWTWPPGRTVNLFYPVGTSVIYTDSLPLLALPLKLFDAWLPETFQYIGFWFFFSCLLQGGVGAILLRRYLTDPVQLLAAIVLLLHAPIFVSRFGHDTLTSQWLLLAALALYFHRPARAETAWWASLSAIAALVHPYLAAMVLGVLAATAARRVLVDRMMHLRTAGLGLGACVVAAGLAWWLAGTFTIPRNAGSGGVPFGIYSMNLLAPFDAAGYSRLIPPLPRAEGQHEGFAWPGLGGWMILLAALAAAVTRKGENSARRLHWPLAMLCVASALFALSTVIRFGNITLMDQPLQQSLLGVFRSSGRFIWVPYYVKSR